jgi:hypothetical protein
MKYVGFTLLGVVAFVGLILLITGLQFWGIGVQRVTQPYVEETRRRTWENSASREQGVNQMIASYCLNMRQASDPGSRKAFAHFILDQSMTFHGELTGDVATCVNEAHVALNQ